MDARIGTIIRNGQKRFYAFVNGYDAPETVGSLEEVEVALGLRVVQAKPTAATASRLARSYTVTLMWQGGDEEEIEVVATSHAMAIQKGRDWKRMEYGRTRSCYLVPCTFRARLTRED
jgi:hypothetical protein